MRALYEALRLDNVGAGVRFTTVDPGMVETEFSSVRFRGDSQAASKVYAGMHPLTPDDVAEVSLEAGRARVDRLVAEGVKRSAAARIVAE